ncbi:MAG: CBS domain-containing protein [Candidatus Odinarchaeia archaeon]
MHPTDNLKLAFHKLVTSGVSRIPVIDPNNPKILLGMISRKDIERVMDL